MSPDTVSPDAGVAAFADCVDLASADLGGQALWASDDFFAEKESLLQPAPAVFLAGEYTDRGKWMDGWESRRKRVPGHDVCIVALGAAGRIRGLDIDTHHFLGNHPPFASVDAVFAPGATVDELRTSASWTEILAPAPLRRGSHNLFAVLADGRFTHVRLRIYPDGGVARLRVYGVAVPEPGDGEVDLAAIGRGGRALWCSDMFFSPMNNLLLPGQPADMGGGWETRRSRPPGQDGVILRLGAPGRLRAVTVETRHFKGNYPDAAAVDALCWPDAPAPALIAADWTEIVPWTRLKADDSRELAVSNGGPWTHLRLRIRPDGGVSRLRAWGVAESPAAGQDALLQWCNQADPVTFSAALTRCCGSARWVASMLSARPFLSRTQLFGLADWLWWRLDDSDWRESFAHHPRIGADINQLRARFAATAGWSSAEQGGVANASEAVLAALAEGNRAYDARFGYLFIVCASGLDAEQMLSRLTERLEHNSPAAEIRVAAGEQARITALRLSRLESEITGRST